MQVNDLTDVNEIDRNRSIVIYGSGITGKICLDILDMLHIEDKRIVAEFSLDMHEEPVYPVVKDILGLKWSDQFIRNGRVAKKACEKMDFREYIEEYLWWCYGRDDKGHIRI